MALTFVTSANLIVIVCFVFVVNVAPKYYGTSSTAESRLISTRWVLALDHFFQTIKHELLYGVGINTVFQLNRENAYQSNEFYDFMFYLHTPQSTLPDIAIRDRSTFNHDGIPPGHNYRQNGRHIYGRVHYALSYRLMIHWSMGILLC